MFITPMSEMIAEMMRLCEDWDTSIERGDIVVPDMLLNDTMAHNSLGIIKKFIRELQGKLDDSKQGVYRHRASEWKQRIQTKTEGKVKGGTSNEPQSKMPQPSPPKE